MIRYIAIAALRSLLASVSFLVHSALLLCTPYALIWRAHVPELASVACVWALDEQPSVLSTQYKLSVLVIAFVFGWLPSNGVAKASFRVGSHQLAPPSGLPFVVLLL